jgi:hypothetical protein
MTATAALQAPVATNQRTNTQVFEIDPQMNKIQKQLPED